MKMDRDGRTKQAPKGPMSRRRVLGSALGLAFAMSACDRRAADTVARAGDTQGERASTVAPLQLQAEVWKTPNCGCCKAWVKHLQDNGFGVVAHDVPDTGPKRAELGMPEKLGSCHTARVGNYAIEGHVPAADIQRLLAENRHAIGLAVPGMPIGSPGMEQGSRRDKFDVLLVLHGGEARVFQSHS